MDGAHARSVSARMAILARQSGVEVWARTFDRRGQQADTGPEGARVDIRGLFGGMGSLNDLVLQKTGLPLVQENTEFDELRGQLYELSRHP